MTWVYYTIIGASVLISLIIFIVVYDLFCRCRDSKKQQITDGGPPATPTHQFSYKVGIRCDEASPSFDVQQSIIRVDMLDNLNRYITGISVPCFLFQFRQDLMKTDWGSKQISDSKNQQQQQQQQPAIPLQVLQKNQSKGSQYSLQPLQLPQQQQPQQAIPLQILQKNQSKGSQYTLPIGPPPQPVAAAIAASPQKNPENNKRNQAIPLQALQRNQSKGSQYTLPIGPQPQPVPPAPPAPAGPQKNPDNNKRSQPQLRSMKSMSALHETWANTPRGPLVTFNLLRRAPLKNLTSLRVTHDCYVSNAFIKLKYIIILDEATKQCARVDFEPDTCLKAHHPCPPSGFQVFQAEKILDIKQLDDVKSFTKSIRRKFICDLC